MSNFDITIIGGGLAGSTAGILLARRGFKVRILEKNSSPKPKVCGEFLSPSIWPLLDRLGLSEKLLALGGRPIRSVIFSGKQELRFNLPIVHPDFPFGYGISRNTLDPFFLNAAQEAGCEILEMEGSARELRGKTKILIRAGGRIHVGAIHELPLLKIGFKAHFDGPSIGDSIKLFFFDGGYFGLVDVEGHQVNCCGIVRKQALKKYGCDFDHLLERAADQNPAFRDWISKARKKMEWITCAPLIHGKRNRNEDRIFHVGDAACFVEPFLGQGMTMALATSFALNAALEKIPSHETEWQAVINNYNNALKDLYRSRVGIGNILNSVAFSWKRSQWALEILHPLRFLGNYILHKTCVGAPLMAPSSGRDKSRPYTANLR